MKKLVLLGAFMLLNCTFFSCTTDDSDTQTNATKRNSDLVLQQEVKNQGPDDDPIVVPPPPIKKP